MKPQEQIAYLQEQRDRMVRELELAREAEARQQATTQPVPHESQRLLEGKIAQCDEMMKEAAERHADQARAADEIQRSVMDKAIETTKDVSALGIVDHVLDAGLGDYVTNSLVSQGLDHGIDMVEGRADLYAKAAMEELIDQTMAVMFPDQTKDLQDMVDRHIQAQDDLKRDIEAIEEKFNTEHPDAPSEQRHALEEQARAAREALERQQAAELQRMMERQQEQTPPIRF